MIRQTGSYYASLHQSRPKTLIYLSPKIITSRDMLDVSQVEPIFHQSLEVADGNHVGSNLHTPCLNIQSNTSQSVARESADYVAQDPAIVQEPAIVHDPTIMLQRTNRGRNLSSLSNVKNNPHPFPLRKWLRFANVNARSVKNKAAVIVDHVVSNNIDFCMMTETWLKDWDSVSAAALSPPGYSFKSFPRQSDRKGGDTGIMFNHDLEVSLINGGEKRSFEFSEWNFPMIGRVIKVVVVYCPPFSEAHPVSSNVFLEDFSTYFRSVSGQRTAWTPFFLL